MGWTKFLGLLSFKARFAPLKPPHRREPYWRCQCDCGKELIRRQADLKSGYTKSCGCMRLINLKGKRFGRLLVIVRVGPMIAPRRREPYWRCQCDCGTEKVCSTSNLVSGRTQSCGCYQRELPHPLLRHGHAKKGKVSKTWRVWAAIQMRCYWKEAKCYEYYGGRGITVCLGWRSNFESFLSDMGESPPDRSIDRVDNSKGYWCGHCEECIINGWERNCQWATKRQQSRNRRNNRFATINGQTKIIIEWSEQFDLPYRTVMGRIYRGISPEKALLGVLI